MRSGHQHRNGFEEPNRFGERADYVINVRVEPVYLAGQVVNVVEVEPGHPAMMGIETPDQGLAKINNLGPHPGQGHIGKDLRIAFAVD